MPNRGRPRSKESTKKILRATRKLLADGNLRDLAIEQVAREAGVAKTTIYRWWPNKSILVLEAFSEDIERVKDFETFQSAAEEIEHQVLRLVKRFAGVPGHIVKQILASGQADPDVLRVYRERFLDRRRREAAEVLQRGIDQGEFRRDIDLDQAIDLIWGPVYFRLLLEHQPLEAGFATTHARFALGAIVARS